MNVIAINSLREKCNKYLPLELQIELDTTLLELQQGAREVAELRRQAEHYDCNVAILTQQRDRAGARLAEAERDAARYRWIKANHLQTGADSWIRTGDDLEEAVDAAMERQP